MAPMAATTAATSRAAPLHRQHLLQAVPVLGIGIRLRPALLENAGAVDDPGQPGAEQAQHPGDTGEQEHRRHRLLDRLGEPPQDSGVIWLWSRASSSSSESGAES